MPKKTNFNVNGKSYFKVSATIGTDSNGNPIRKVFYGKSQKEALLKKEEYMSQLKKGLAIDFDKLVIGELIYEWLFEVVKNNVKPSTLERYESIYRVHIKDSEIYNLKVSQIKSMHIQRYYNNLIEKNKTVPTIEAIHKLLKKFFNYCIKEDLIIKSPCLNVNMPKELSTNNRDIEVFTNDEIKIINDEIKINENYFIFMFALMTGLRQGEILALTYKDIDLDNAMVTVNKALKNVKLIEKDGKSERKSIIQSPKSKASIRTVPLPTTIIPYLENHIKNEKIKYLRLGLVYDEHEKLLFTNGSGNVIDPGNLRTIWKRFLSRLNIPFRKFHTLRHTYCTKLAENGVSLKTASTLMGHDISMTARIYTHVDDVEKKKAVNAINHII